MTLRQLVEAALRDQLDEALAEVERLREALAAAHGLIAANRLVLGEYSGTREVADVERRIRAALGETP